jgi:hypothetical protein
MKDRAPVMVAGDPQTLDRGNLDVTKAPRDLDSIPRNGGILLGACTGSPTEPGASPDGHSAPGARAELPAEAAGLLPDARPDLPREYAGTVPDAWTPLDDFDRWLPQISDAECQFEVPFVPVHGDPSEFHPRTVCESGCDHTTLDALAAAQPFDEISLAPDEYDECVVRVSPIVIRGNGGFARFTNVDCPSDGPLIAVESAYAQLSGIRVEGFRGNGLVSAVATRTGVRQFVLSRSWFEKVDRAVGGSSDGGEAWLDRIKIGGYREDSAFGVPVSREESEARGMRPRTARDVAATIYDCFGIDQFISEGYGVVEGISRV